MKKIFIFIAFVCLSVFANAQSIQLHQSYNTDNINAPYSSTRAIVDYFGTSKNGNWNVFSWNTIDHTSLSTLLYVEYLLGNSNFYVHPEFRANYGFDNKAWSSTFQIGFAYLIPWENGPSFYLTPKYSLDFARVTYGGRTNSYYGHNIQFSINSAYENDYIYYEGYIDNTFLLTVNGYSSSDCGYSFFAEQKAYYKFSEAFQIGLCFVFNGTAMYKKEYSDANFFFCQPYFSLRFSLY